ncbi:MAG: hypothetical protein IJ507_09955 [Clostridia bacterium]|nr:hypothetical protein [Clostridia bacterium]
MIKVYKEENVIRASECDLNAQWKPSAILETMQEMAGKHGELIGVGRNALMQEGVIWILTRVEVEMDRYPRHREIISTETFPMPNRRWFFPRYFIFRDEQGHEIGRAGTLWALLDLNSRRMARPDTVMRLMPDNSDLTAPMGLPATVAEVSGTLQIGTVSPVYTDLDMNGHVNNVKYMDWCCNALGVDTMKDKCLRRFALNYDMEVLPGQALRTELRTLGDAFSFCGFDGEQRHFDVGGVLAERK